MKEMTPGAVRERLQERPDLVVPVGTTEQHGPHLPLGCDTIIVERLADDLSADVRDPARADGGVRRPRAARMRSRAAPRCGDARCIGS